MTDPHIVSRHEWGARTPKMRRLITLPSSELWWHHFATTGWHGPSGMRRCQAFHMDRKGWSDIAYSFCVDDDGTIYEGRGAGVAGGHTNGRNTISHAICLMTNADQVAVTTAALEACARLAAHGIERDWWTGWTGGHRDAPGANTACPGRHAISAYPDLIALTDRFGRNGNGTNPQEKDMDEAIRAIYHLWRDDLHAAAKDIDGWKFWHAHGEANGFAALVNDLTGALAHEAGF